MGRSVVATLDSQELAQLQDGIKQISTSGNNSATDGFRFVAGFDGTYNNRLHLGPGEYQTNVANVIDQVQASRLNGANVFGGYYSGVGTGGQNGGVFAAAVSPTTAIHFAAEAALVDFAKQARDYLNANPGATYADLSASVIGFSRGCATGVVFAQLVNERGLQAADGTMSAPSGGIRIQGMAPVPSAVKIIDGHYGSYSNGKRRRVVCRLCLKRSFYVTRSRLAITPFQEKNIRLPPPIELPWICFTVSSPLRAECPT